MKIAVVDKCSFDKIYVTSSNSSWFSTNDSSDGGADCEGVVARGDIGVATASEDGFEAEDGTGVVAGDTFEEIIWVTYILGRAVT